MTFDPRINHLRPEDRDLVVCTLETLAEADLKDVAEDFIRRVVPPDCRGRFARVAGEEYLDGLNAMMETLLYDLHWLATAPGMTPAMRRQRAAENLALLGFPPHTPGDDEC